MKTFADFGIDIPFGQSGEFDVTCPACTDGRKRENQRRKDLGVNTVLGTWFCQHCGWKGGLGSSDGTLPPLMKTYQAPRALPDYVTPTVWETTVAWFAKRGISEAVLARNRVTAARMTCQPCETYKDTVLFPYFRGETHVNTKYRCMKKHFRMDKGAERILYGLNDIEGASVCIWVEGEIDKLSVEMAGFTNCVSVPDGAPTPDVKSYSSKFDFLDSAKPTLDRIGTHILICDEDAPGYALTEELSRRLGREKCKRGTFPDGIKDANDCLTLVGPEELRRVIEDAEPYPIEGVTMMRDLAVDLEDLYVNGFDEGLRLGWPKFDELYRVRAGLMTIITGIPGHGKSNWLDQLLIEIVMRYGWSIGICSPENQPLKRHAASLIAKYVGKPFHSPRGPVDRMTDAEARRARLFLDRHISFILPDDPSLDAILESAKALVYRTGIKGLVIDPWNEVEHGRPPHMSETEYVGKALGQVRRFARTHDVHVWVVAHPTKLRKEDDGSEAVPRLYDINGSANFRNKADYGITVWRDIADPMSPNHVHVTKVRFQETGRLGMVEFWYDPPTGRFREDRSKRAGEVR